tara:strand:- start:42 stop:707 length:666 start_codon:yes stop_codon:yes gene_type:complete
MFTSYRNPENQSPAFVVHNVFAKEICNKIIETYKDQTDVATHVGKNEKIKTGNMRNSNVCFFNDPQTTARIQTMIKVANHCTGWDFDITATEQIQFTKYESDQHYSWHFDGFGDNLAKRTFIFPSELSKNPGLRKTTDPNLIGTCRKISVSVLLNDDFSGGEFDTAWLDADDGKLEVRKSTFKPKTGDMIIFPSHIPHRVRPVRVGTRYSLVVWAGGPAFK